jgi:hypothetical protein
MISDFSDTGIANASPFGPFLPREFASTSLLLCTDSEILHMQEWHRSISGTLDPQ